LQLIARGVCSAIVLSSLGVLLAASPATRPSTLTTPSTTRASAPRPIPSTQERQKAMAEWFAALSHPDPEARERARQSLLTLQRADLPALKKLVHDSRPLSPSQATALHDIVVHVYLTGEEYMRSNKGFLGVKLGSGTVEAEENEQQVQPVPGAIIVDRMPGFAGFRAFQNGDVVLSIKERPGLTIESVPDFQAVIMSSTAGTTLHMEVVRQMRTIEVEITLDARPDGDAEDETNILEKKGELYWNEEFAPVVIGGVS
jgi:hypothetical protein